MAPHGVVEAVDIAGNGLPGLGAGVEHSAPDELGCDRPEERLGHGVIEAGALARCRLNRCFCLARRPFSGIGRAVRRRPMAEPSSLSSRVMRGRNTPRFRRCAASVEGVSCGALASAMSIARSRRLAIQRVSVDSQPSTLIRDLPLRAAVGRRQPYRLVLELLRTPPLLRHRVRLHLRGTLHFPEQIQSAP